MEWDNKFRLLGFDIDNNLQNLAENFKLSTLGPLVSLMIGDPEIYLEKEEIQYTYKYPLVS